MSRALRQTERRARWQVSWVFGADLLTGPARRHPKIALRRPILSGPADLGVLVRSSKTQVKGRFWRGGQLLWFEPHLPKIHTLRANTSVLLMRVAAHCFNLPPTFLQEKSIKGDAAVAEQHGAAETGKIPAAAFNLAAAATSVEVAERRGPCSPTLSSLDPPSRQTSAGLGRQAGKRLLSST